MRHGAVNFWYAVLLRPAACQPELPANERTREEDLRPKTSPEPTEPAASSKKGLKATLTACLISETVRV